MKHIPVALLALTITSTTGCGEEDLLAEAEKFVFDREHSIETGYGEVIFDLDDEGSPEDSKSRLKTEDGVAKAYKKVSMKSKFVVPILGNTLELPEVTGTLYYLLDKLYFYISVEVEIEGYGAEVGTLVLRPFADDEDDETEWVTGSPEYED